MRRFTVAAMVGLIAVLTLALPASATRGWCARDPIVTIGGTTVQIWVAIPDGFEPFVEDAVEVKVKAPKNLARRLIYTDEGFNGHGEKVSWGDVNDENPNDGIAPIEIEVKVKFDISDMEKAFGKDRLKTELNENGEVPIQVTVNVGKITQEYDTIVEYGSNNKTRVQVSIATVSDAIR